MVFESRDSVSFLKAWIHSQPKGGWGVRSKIADVLGCKSSYVSQILSGKAQLNPEQAVLLARFFKLSKEERVYFLLMVQKECSGPIELKRLLDEKLADLRTDWYHERNLDTHESKISLEDEIVHFSSWVHVAVSLCVFLPGCETAAGIAKKLGIPIDRVDEAVRFHLSRGILIKKKGHLRPGPQRFFLDRESPVRKKFLEAWRLQAIRAVDAAKGRDFHTTVVVSLRKEDVAYANTVLEEALLKINERVAMIPMGSGEQVHAFGIDSFKITK